MQIVNIYKLTIILCSTTRQGYYTVSMYIKCLLPQFSSEINHLYKSMHIHVVFFRGS